MARWLVFTIALVSVSGPAAAKLYEREPFRVEAGLEMAFVVFDAEERFADFAPRTLYGLVGGVHVVEDLRVGAALRATISDPDGEHYEVLANVSWSWVDEPRLPDPPALRIAASLEAGWRSTRLEGSEFVTLDRGFVVSLGVGVGIVVFDDVALSLQTSGVAGSSSNPDFTPWAPKLRVGVTLSTLL